MAPPWPIGATRPGVPFGVGASSDIAVAVRVDEDGGLLVRTGCGPAAVDPGRAPIEPLTTSYLDRG